MKKLMLIVIGLLLSFQMLQASVEKTVTLNAGYNAVQFDANVTLEYLVEKIGFENLISIQGAGQGSTYKKQYVDDGLEFLNSFSKTEPGKAFWFKVNTDVTFGYIADIFVGSKNIDLGSGWSFVGAMLPLPLEEIKTQLGADNLLVVQGAGQGSTYKKEYIDNGTPFLNSFTAFEVGKGYWIKVENPAILSFVFSNNPSCITLDDLKTKIANNEDVTEVNTSCITDMRRLFASNYDFNQDIGGWDVSNVTTMRSMFDGAENFTQNIGSWDVSNVTDMSHMFAHVKDFNQNLGQWNVSSVTNMFGMFYRAFAFNQDISNWNVSNVINMKDMFYQTATFNQNIGLWNVSNLSDMTDMFAGSNSLSIENYDALLNGWSSKTLQSGVVFSGGNNKYSDVATASRQSIIDTYGWTITDGGLDVTPQEIAQAKIEAYAENSTNPLPTLQDYIDAGVIGVTVENLDDVNSVVNDASRENVDTVEELNALVETINNNSGADLLINELSGGIYTNSSRWFELYNASSSNIDLSDYTLKSRYYDGSTSGIFEFTLPSKIIPAGAYLIVRPNYGPAYDTTLADIENNQVIYLKDTASTKYPFWSSTGQGFLELLKAGETVDFVTFGAAYTPTTATAWSGAYLPSFDSEDWKSIARDSSSTDSNTLSDWTERSFQTYAGINDVTCNDDADEDGIPDCSEMSGSTYAGLDLYGFGARVNQKDIFIEVDYMDSTNGGTLELDEGTVPHQRALEKVKASFAANGYAVHFDVGNLFSENGAVLDPSKMDLGGGNQVAYSLAVNLDCTNAGVNAREYKVDNMKVQRKQIFYYMLFGTSQNSNGSSGSSGCAESPGNDSLMTLGGWNLSTSSEENTNILINFQAGTVMHEFGHNLGLDHGGDESKNYKPNYVSVMNYLYQLRGLPTIGDNEGDRYYNNYYNSCSNIYSSETNPFWGSPDDFRLDYSHGNGSDLDEVNGVVEGNGLGQTNSGPVDFNCNGLPDDVLTNYNVNTSGDNVVDTLEDHNDWGTLNIVFSRTYSGNSGITNHLSSREVPTVNPLSNDIQPVIKEEPIKIPSMVN